MKTTLLEHSKDLQDTVIGNHFECVGIFEEINFAVSKTIVKPEGQNYHIY